MSTSFIEMLQRLIESTQYASDAHRKLIDDYQMTQSMSRRANCWDNAAMESFFKTLTVELIYPQRYVTRAHGRKRA